MAEKVYGFFCRHCGVSLADRQNRRDRNCRLCGHEKATLAFRCICGQARLGGNVMTPHAECRRLLQLEKDNPILQCSMCISEFIQSVAQLMQQIQATDDIGNCLPSSSPSQPRPLFFSVTLKKKDVLADISAIVSNRYSSIPEEDIALLEEILVRTHYEERMELLADAEEEYRVRKVETSSYTRGRTAAVRAAQHKCSRLSTNHDLKPPYTSWLFSIEVDALMETLVKPLLTVQVLNCQENIDSVAKTICSAKRLEVCLPIVCPVIVDHNHFVLVIRSTDERVVFVDSKSSGSEAACRHLKKALRFSSTRKLEVTHHLLGVQVDQFSCGHWVAQFARLAAVNGLPVSNWLENIVSLKLKWADVVRHHHEILAAHRLVFFRPKR